LIRYAFPQNGGEASIQGDAQYRSSSIFPLTNFDATRVKSYTLLNALAVFGKNPSDERYRTVGFEASDSGSSGARHGCNHGARWQRPRPTGHWPLARLVRPSGSIQAYSFCGPDSTHIRENRGVQTTLHATASTVSTSIYAPNVIFSHGYCKCPMK
jgi:hypothetical protein